MFKPLSRRDDGAEWADRSPLWPPRESWNARDKLIVMAKDLSASAVIDARLKELGDWRGSMLARLRALIRQADPDVIEEWKWVKATSPGVPVFIRAAVALNTSKGRR